MLVLLMTGCVVVVYELTDQWDIAEQRVSSGTSAEGTGFIDFSEEARYYAWGVRYHPDTGEFVGYLDPEIQTDASVSSLDLDEAPVLGLRYGDSQISFLAVEDGPDILLQAADPWGAGVDLEVLLSRP